MDDPYRLSLTIEHADGRVTRWGPDELEVEDVPSGLEFGSAIPGGYKGMSCELFRRMDLDYADLNEFDTITVYGPGREIAWQGRLARAPREHGDRYVIQPGGEGWSAHLGDDKTFQMIYVDRDLGRWGSPSLSRRLDMATSGTPITGEGTVAPDPTNGSPAVLQSITRVANKAFVESWYDAGSGNLIDAFYYDVDFSHALASGWGAGVLLAETDRAVGYEGASLVADAASYFDPSGTDHRFAMVRLYFDAAFTGDGDWRAAWRSLAVYGDHGLTRRGSDPGGLYASDVVEDIVQRAAPLLDTSLVEENTFIVPHLAFPDPTTAEAAVRKVTDYTLWEWGVYDDRKFFWRQPDPDRVCWRARLSDGARPQFDGPSGVDRPNGVLVTYQDFAGQTHIAGPTGSGAEVESALLLDDDPLNPANRWGIRNWTTLSIPEPTNADAALQLGSVWLAERVRQAERRGEIAITGLVEHPTKGLRPVWAIKAGDYIQLTDAANDVKRRIMEVHYDHDTRTATLTLDNTAYRADALMERMAVAIVGVV